MNWVRKKNRALIDARTRGRRILSGLTAATLLTSSLVALGLAAPTAAQAAPGDPFDPAAPTVFVAQSPVDGSTGLYRSETTGDGKYAFTPEGPVLASGRYNAISFNRADNFIYGVGDGPIGGIPANALVRIGEGGKVTRVGTLLFPGPQPVGAFNTDNGLLYTSTGSGSPGTVFSVVNVTTGNIVSQFTTNLPGMTIADMEYLDGYFWAVDYGSGQTPGTLVRINPANGVATRFPGVIPNAPSGAWGAAWMFGNGNLGFSNNGTGTIAQVKIMNPASATPTFSTVSLVPGPPSTGNDGTSIPGLPADLAIVKSGPATYVRGSRIGFSITVTNNGAGVSSGWTVTDTLPTGLSNPSVLGSVTIAQDPNDPRILTFNGGRLDPGESMTFTVFADTTRTPNTCVVNTASVLGNELDPVDTNNESAATSCDLGLTIQKTSDATADTRPGDVVTYTVTATNTGAGAFTASNPARIYDDLSGVLDDAAYNADASASRPGTIGYTAPRLSWSGALAAGASVSLTYTVTMRGSGDGVARNVAWRPGDPGITTPPSCDPAPGGVDAATGQPCAVTSFELPRLTIDKSADRTDLPAAGDTVTYTIVVANPGPGDYTAAAPATATDDLSAVLDDATFVAGSLSSSSGTATRAGDTITWSGALAAGQQATITYRVAYTGGGDQVLRNTACVPTAESLPGAVPCDTVRIPGALLNQWKTATPSSDPVVAGSTITYTLFFDNDGQTAATVDAVDDLRYVTDDADVTIEPTSSSGLTAVRTGDRISVTGSVPVGATSTVTYTVTVRPDGQRGDNVATNFLLPPGEDPPPGVCACPPTPRRRTALRRPSPL